jgi:hypothetical protein
VVDGRPPSERARTKGAVVNPIEPSPPRRLRLFLRDHRILDADARVPNGQTLATYLASRSRYVNLTGVDWVGTGSTIPHLALRVGTILWASSEDGTLPLTAATTLAGARRVDLELEGGYLIGAGLMLVDTQRLSDYLQAAPAFIPLRNAELRPRSTSLGDIVVNQETIQAVREVSGTRRTDGAPLGDAALAPGSLHV